ncbi:trpE operon leader peptide TrpLE [Sinorhizobium kostiense]
MCDHTATVTCDFPACAPSQGRLTLLPMANARNISVWWWAR